MATVEVEINEDGTPGTLPAPLQELMNKRIDEAYQKGANKAEKRLGALVVDPKELETLRTAAKELEDAKLVIAERDKDWKTAQDIRDKRHADELKSERDAHLKTRGKVREFVGKSIRIAAVEAGARTESLDELEHLIGAAVDLDADLNPFVKGEDGSPRTNDKGETVTLEGFIREYLDRKPHHKAAPAVKGGKAPGGAAYRGTPPSALTGKDAIRAALDEDGANPATQRAMIAALTKRA